MATTIDEVRATYEAAKANGTDEEFVAAKAALIERTTSRALTADEIAYI